MSTSFLSAGAPNFSPHHVYSHLYPRTCQVNLPSPDCCFAAYSYSCRVHMELRPSETCQSAAWGTRRWLIVHMCLPLATCKWQVRRGGRSVTLGGKAAARSFWYIASWYPDNVRGADYSEFLERREERFSVSSSNIIHRSQLGTRPIGVWIEWGEGGGREGGRKERILAKI